MKSALLLLFTYAAAAGAPPSAKTNSPNRHWGNWRGPAHTGVAPTGNPPVHWSESKNIKWKTPLAGRGHSSPVVWGDKVFVTLAQPIGEAREPQREHDPHAHDNLPSVFRQNFDVIALDLKTGTPVWHRTVRTAHPHEGTHETGSWASHSAVTDGEIVIAHFGSQGTYGLTTHGELAWQIDLGDMQTRHGHGEGSSPALWKDWVVINWDHEGDSFLVALDKNTGKIKWKTARDEMTSWSSPLIVEHQGKPQVVVAATGRVRGYDLATGHEIWQCAGLSRNVVATPVSTNGTVYVANSYDWQAMLAIRLDLAKGDITDGPAIAWKADRNTPYVPSPLLYDDTLYYIKHLQAFLSATRAADGGLLFGPARLPGVDMVFASPVGAAGRIYVVARNGVTVVLEHGPELNVLARNRLSDSFSATPAIVGNKLLLRGEEYIYCLAEEPD